MTDRVIAVKLRAEMDQYKREMAQAAAATERLGGSGEKAGMRMSSAFKAVATSAAALGIAKLVKDSVSLEAAYSKTMRQVAVQTKAPKAALAELDDLAMKLGADTVFSAQDAADAMLELAKGGLSTAQIEAGALKNSLTLAAAGGLELGDAANSVVNTMGAFGLSAKQTGSAVAALAGAANASSADVSDITQALAQAGTSAKAAGLSVQETTAFLAAFANAGIQGSDAGTGLRTLLTRLVPATKAQSVEMERLGLSFTKSNGEFVSGAEIAGRLQQAYKGMSAAERTASLQKVFGQDAQRAANVLIEQGSKGIASLTKETSDLNAAQELADASMQGTSGALEQLDGAIETAKIQIGKGLAPVISEIATDMSNWLEGADVEGWARNAGQGVGDFVDEMKPLVSSLFDLGRSALPAVADAGQVTIGVLKTAADVVKPFVDAFNALPESAQKALIVAAGVQTLNNKLGLTQRLAESAAGQMLVVGGSADTAGTRAKKGAGGFAALGSSLKTTAAIAGVYAALDLASDLAPDADIAGPEKLTKAIAGLGTDADMAKKKIDDLFTIEGSGLAATEGLQSAFKSISDNGWIQALDTAGSAFGLFDKNIDLAKDAVSSYDQALAAMIGKGNLREAAIGADYFAEQGRKAGKSSKEIAELLPAYSAALSGLDESQRRAIDSVNVLAETQPKVANAFLISAYGMERYKSQLIDLPTAVVTQILTPGAIKSAADVESLVRKYELTPDLVRTIVETSGVDISKGRLNSIIDLAERINRKKARAAVSAATDAANRALRSTFALLRSLDGQRADVTVRTIKETFNKPSKSDPKSTLADMLNRGRATGGTVPPGFAGGGIVPGVAPADPRVDNVLAFGATSKQPIMVRSGEWIINPKQSDANSEWLAAINAGLNLNDILGSASKYASGGQYDAATSLELTQMRVRIRDLIRSLNAREKYGKKGKDGKQPTRYELRGLDRLQARQELAEAKDELRGTLRVTRAGRRRGMGPERYNAYREAQAEKREAAKQAREDLKNARADASSSFLDGNASIGDFTTPASIERALQRSLVDMATFTSLLIDLKKKGASPWLLEQLQKAGPSRGTIGLARKYLADTGALQRINALSAQATDTSNIYGRVVSDPKFLTAGTRSVGVTAAQVRRLDVNVQSLDQTAQARETTRVLSHELQSLAAGAGV